MASTPDEELLYLENTRLRAETIDELRAVNKWSVFMNEPSGETSQRTLPLTLHLT